MDEQERYALYERLQEVLGPVPAATLMEGLPWSGRDLATKQDLEELEQRLEQRLDLRLEQNRAEFRAELATALAAQTRTVVLTVVLTVVFALVAAVVSTAQLVAAAG